MWSVTVLLPLKELTAGRRRRYCETRDRKPELVRKKDYSLVCRIPPLRLRRRRP